VDIASLIYDLLTTEHYIVGKHTMLCFRWESSWKQRLPLKIHHWAMSSVEKF